MHMENVSLGSLKNPSSQDLERLSTLSEVSNLLNSSLDNSTLLSAVLEGVLKAFRADRGFIQLYDQAGLTLQELFLDASNGQKWEAFQFTKTLLANCRESMVPVLVIDTQEVPATQSVMMTGIRSVMLAPLLVKDKLLGVIYLDSLLRAGCFEENDLKLFSVLAKMVSTAVDRNLKTVKVEEQSEALDVAQEKLNQAAEETILRLSRAAEFRDGETSDHLTRVSHYCEAIGHQLNLGEERVEAIKVASLLHDVGKLGIPDSIMLKPGRFTDYERSVMQQHTLFGAKILGNSQSPIISLAAEIALRHHEKWDGSGYPNGLSGTDIPLAARIVAMADVFDAVSSARRYKESYSLDDSFSLIQKESGSHFDPEIVEAFLTLRPKIEQIWNDNQGTVDSPTTEDVDESKKGTEASSSSESSTLEPPNDLDSARKVLDSIPIVLAKESGLSEEVLSRVFSSIEVLAEYLGDDAQPILLEFTEFVSSKTLTFQQAPKLAELVKQLSSLCDKVLDDESGVPQLLILDSDPYQREVLSTEATRRGMVVHECSNRTRALEILFEDPPDLLILELADEGSEEIFTKLKKEQPSLPILILTRDGDLARRLAVSGFTGCSYLHKPLPPAAILDEVEEKLPENDVKKSLTVLAFDDDAVVLTVIAKVLRRNGYNVFTVSEPLEFWELLTEHDPDILLLDLEMPQVSGFDICRILRNDVEFRHLPIVVLTAHQEISEYEKALAAGADDVLAKPLQARRLLTRIESRLARNRALQISGSRDPLTGFVHRRLALRTAEQMFASSLFNRVAFSVCSLEIEHFDKLIEQNGWQSSHGIFRQMADILTRACRPQDVITRSENFTLLLMLFGVDKEGVEQRIHSLNTKISQHQGALGAIRCVAKTATSPDDGHELKKLLEKVGFSYNASY